MINQGLEHVKVLLNEGKFRTASEQIESIENSESLTGDKRLFLMHLKSTLYIRKGELRKGKQIAEILLKECRKTGNQKLEFDVLIDIITVSIMLGDINNSRHLIKQNEKLLQLLNQDNPADSEKRLASIYFCKGLLENNKGEVNQAQKLLEKSLSLREMIGDKLGIIDVLFELGYIFHINKMYAQISSVGQKLLTISESMNNLQGIAKAYVLYGLSYRIKSEFNCTIEYFQKSMDIAEGIDDRITCTRSLLNLGIAYGNKGETALALEYCLKSLEAYEEMGYQSFLAYQYLICGNFYSYLGDLDKAMEFTQISLDKFEMLGHRRGMATCLNNLGDAMGDKGDYDKAMEYFTRSLEFSRELKFDSLISDSLYQLIKYYNDVIPQEILQKYLEEFKGINGRHNDVPQINQRYQLTKAILLKTQGRLADKGLAQRIFQKITEEEIIDLELTVEALINLFELLLFELEITEDEAVLEELNKISKRLLYIAKMQDAGIYIVQAYLILSKIKILELNLPEAHKLLTQSLIIAQEKGLTRLEQIISVEEESLVSQLTTWNKIIEQQPSIKEIIKLTQLGDLISRIFHKRQFQKEEEILAYAKKAKKLVQGWD